jgi:hypothetical protein
MTRYVKTKYSSGQIDGMKTALKSPTRSLLHRLECCEIIFSLLVDPDYESYHESLRWHIDEATLSLAEALERRTAKGEVFIACGMQFTARNGRITRSLSVNRPQSPAKEG